jgi:hypothetical protein
VIPVEVPEVMRSTESISIEGCALSYVPEGMRCVLEDVEAGGVEMKCRKVWKVRLCVGKKVSSVRALYEQPVRRRRVDTVGFASK